MHKFCGELGRDLGRKIKNPLVGILGLLFGSSYLVPKMSLLYYGNFSFTKSINKFRLNEELALI